MAGIFPFLSRARSFQKSETLCILLFLFPPAGACFIFLTSQHCSFIFISKWRLFFNGCFHRYVYYLEGRCFSNWINMTIARAQRAFTRNKLIVAMFYCLQSFNSRKNLSCCYQLDIMVRSLFKRCNFPTDSLRWLKLFREFFPRIYETVLAVMYICRFCFECHLSWSPRVVTPYKLVISLLLHLLFTSHCEGFGKKPS